MDTKEAGVIFGASRSRWHTSSPPLKVEFTFSMSLPSCSFSFWFRPISSSLACEGRALTIDEAHAPRAMAHICFLVKGTSSPRTLCESHLSGVRAGHRLRGVARVPAMLTPSATSKPMFLRPTIIPLDFYENRSTERVLYEYITGFSPSQPKPKILTLGSCVGFKFINSSYVLNQYRECTKEILIWVPQQTNGVSRYQQEAHRQSSGSTLREQCYNCISTVLYCSTEWRTMRVW